MWAPITAAVLAIFYPVHIWPLPLDTIGDNQEDLISEADFDRCAQDGISVPYFNTHSSQVECHPLLQKGPCNGDDEWFVLNEDGWPVCAERDCPSPDQVLFKGTCTSVNSTVACPETMDLKSNPSGAGVCDCKKGYNRVELNEMKSGQTNQSDEANEEHDLDDILWDLEKRETSERDDSAPDFDYLAFLSSAAETQKTNDTMVHGNHLDFMCEPEVMLRDGGVIGNFIEKCKAGETLVTGTGKCVRLVIWTPGQAVGELTQIQEWEIRCKNSPPWKQNPYCRGQSRNFACVHYCRWFKNNKQEIKNTPSTNDLGKMER